MKFHISLFVFCICLIPGLVIANPLEVGTGVNTASVYIEWSDGFNIEFIVHFGIDANETTTGQGLIDIIEAETELTTMRVDYVWGELIDGISYQEHSDAGYIEGELWWHYWENDAGSCNPWFLSMIGAGNRIVTHGDADAWIYGRGDEPPAIDIIKVGSGVNNASVFIEWLDGFTAEFLVFFGQTETETITGLGLIDIIEDETELTTIRENFGSGESIYSISYQRHYNENLTDDDNWWHYWENDSGSRSNWIISDVNAGTHIVTHGDADGWIFGYDKTPAPINENPFMAGYGQYVYDSNDFATTWLAYEPKGMIYDWITYLPFNDPNTALGRPTIDTSGDGWELPIETKVPVVPIYPAIRANELVHLGEGGHITLGFNHQVCDDVENPYGIDFIVFGNCFQMINGTESWSNGDPRSITVGPTGGIEPGIVSVSQDGNIWFSFTNDPNFMSNDPNFIKLDIDDQDGPFCDGFASTFGRVYDPCYADTSVGNWNLWWAEPTNPTLPLDPGLNYASFEGMSLARVSESYGDSAGGTGYDLNRLNLPVDPNTGMKWFQYIRIDDALENGTTEIDAVADVSCPGDYRHPAPFGDLNNDYRVDIEDVKIVEGFLGQEITDPNNPAIFADLNGDGNIDQDDIDIIIENLGICTWDNSTVDE